MADDGGDVNIDSFRKSSFPKKLPRYLKTQLTTCLVSKRSMLTRRSMQFIRSRKPMHQLTA